MEVKELHLENIFCFENITVPFDQLNFTLFVGKNGEGKSAIFDGLCWVLYDQTARRKYDKSKVVRDIPTKQSQAFGWVVLEDGDKSIRIERKRGRENSVKLFIDDSKIDVRTSTLVEEEIEKALGMDYKTFVNIAYFSQGDIGKFLTSDSNERIRIISDILSLDIFDKAVDKCSANIRESERAISSITGQMKVYESDMENVDVDELNLQTKLNKKKLRVVIDEIEVLSHYLDSIREKKEIKKELVSIKKMYDNQKVSVEQHLSFMEKHIQSIKAGKVDENKIKKEILELNENLNEYVLVSKRYDDLISESRDMEIKESQLIGEYKGLKNQVDELEKVKKMEGSECPTCHSIVNKRNIGYISTKIVDINNEMKRVVSRTRKMGDALDINFEGCRALEREMKPWEKSESEIKELEVKLEKSGEVNKEVEKIELEIKDYKKEQKGKLADLKSTYNEKREKYKKYEDIDISKNDEMNKQFDELGDGKSDLQSQIAVNKHKVEKYFKSKENYENLKVQLETINVDFGMLEFWKRVFPKIKLKMINEVIPFVQSETNKYLSEILLGKRIIFDVNPDKAQNRFDLVIEDYEHKIKRIFEGWSGGQQDRMGLSVYLALNKLASLRSGKAVNFLILDEKFAKIDSEGRYVILDMLKKEYEGRKIWAISHVKEIENQFDNVVKVEMNNGVSNINIIQNEGYESQKH